MRLGFVLYMYFPFGGLQRDFLRIATACRERGHEIVVYTMGWEGEVPDGFDVRCLPAKALSNHRRNEVFIGELRRCLEREPVDALIGFNKMPGLDVYFAADPCFEARARQQRSRMYRRSKRYQSFARAEQAVFGPEGRAEILVLTRRAQEDFMQFYDTPAERFHLLPPGISRDRLPPENSAEIRDGLRAEFSIAERESLVLMVGSGFRTKGLDRALRAFAALPEEKRVRSWFFVIGKDNPGPFRRLIKRLQIGEQVSFLQGRHDVARFLLGADLLIHPAYSEAAGMVLLEAMVAGLPVLTTDVCGYAHYVEAVGCGRVLASPFEQQVLNRELATMLDSAERPAWRERGIAFGRDADIFSLPERAADVIESVLERGRG